MTFAGGILHWTEDKFWDSTFYYLSCAYIGHCQANRLGRWAVNERGWSKANIEEHQRKTLELKAKFPDIAPTGRVVIGKRSRKKASAERKIARGR